MSFRRLALLGLNVMMLATLSLAPQSAMAWGAKGHRLTGLIASELISDETRSAMKSIMGSANLAKFSLYMDEQKIALSSRVPGSRDWHYDDIPVCSIQSKSQYCPNGNCASTQISRHYGILVDDHSTKNDKRFAIHVLVHLIADIHQPLHSSDNDDRGGNNVKVQLPWSHNAKLNLHTAWDTSILEKRYGPENEVAVAKRLLATYRDSIPDWQKGKASAWVNESHKLGETQVYGMLPDFACDSEFSGRVTLSKEYVDKAGDLIDEQLVKAGARIAYVLDRALGD